MFGLASFRGGLFAGAQLALAVLPAPPSGLALSATSVAEAAAWGDDLATVTVTPAASAAGKVGDILGWRLTDDAGGKVQVAGAARDLRLEVGRASLIGVSSFNITLTPFGLSGDGAPLTQTITVTAAGTTPANVSTGAPAAAARFDNASLTAGSSVGTIAAAWSATSGVSAGGVAPVARAYGPVGQTVAAFEADNAELAITTPPVTSGAWFADVVLNPQGNGALTLFGSASSNTIDYFQLKQSVANQGFFDRLGVRDHSGTTLTDLTLSRAVFVGRWHALRIVYDNSVVKLYVDGVLSGTSAAYATKVWTLGKVGRLNTVASTARFLLGLAAVWNGTPSGADTTALDAYEEPWRRHQVRVSSVNGSDTSTTFALPGGTPLATPLAAGISTSATTAAQRGRGGDRWAFERGSTFSAVSPNFNLGNSTTGAPYVLEAYGSGALPVFQETPWTTGGWTNNGDGTFTRAYANATVALFIENVAGTPAAADEFLRPVSRALTQDNSYQITGGNLTVRPKAGFDLNAARCLLVYAATPVRGFQVGSGVVAVELYDLAVIGCSLVGFESFATSAFKSYRLKARATADDVSGTNAGSCWFYAFDFAYAGPGDFSSGSGDIISGHGTSTVFAYDGVGYGGRRGAFRHTSSVTATCEGCVFWACWDPLTLINSAVTTAGTLTIRNTEVRIDDWADPANPTGVQIPTGLAAGTAVTVEHCTFVNQRTGTSKWDATVTYAANDTPSASHACYGVDLQSAGTAYTVASRWNVFVGLYFDAHVTSNVTLTRGYNRLWNTAQATGSGYDTDANTTSGDPGFKSLAANDFTPAAGSPLLAAAVGSTSARDKRGRVRAYGYSTSNVNTIGANARAAA